MALVDPVHRCLRWLYAASLSPLSLAVVVADERCVRIRGRVAAVVNLEPDVLLCSPALATVREALDICDVGSVHERTLDLLNLFAAGMAPIQMVAVSAMLDSSQRVWVECVLKVLVVGTGSGT